MARQIVNIGNDANDGSGDTIRDSFNKVNENFVEVYANIVALSDGNVTTDIKGNVFAEDSTLLVDAINGVIPWSVIDGAPTTVAGYGITDAFDGDYDSLNNKPDLTQYLTSLDGDLTGSVFADDSTTIVDGTNANVTANILTSNTASNFNGTLSVVGVTRLYDDLIIDGGDIVSDNSAYFFGNLECSNITNLQNNEFASDNLTLSAEGSIVLNGNVSLGTASGSTDFYGEIEFNSGTTLFQPLNSVDFNCDVDFADANIVGDITSSGYIRLDSSGANIEIGTNTDFNVILGQASTGQTAIYSPKVLLKNTSVPSTSIGTASDLPGEFALDDSYIYYCTDDYDGVTNIWKRVAWSGDTW